MPAVRDIDDGIIVWKSRRSSRRPQARLVGARAAVAPSFREACIARRQAGRWRPAAIAPARAHGRFQLDDNQHPRYEHCFEIMQLCLTDWTWLWQSTEVVAAAGRGGYNKSWAGAPANGPAHATEGCTSMTPSTVQRQPLSRKRTGDHDGRWVVSLAAHWDLSRCTSTSLIRARYETARSFVARRRQLSSGFRGHSPNFCSCWCSKIGD
jgi:hypothetical protein